MTDLTSGWIIGSSVKYLVRLISTYSIQLDSNSTNYYVVDEHQNMHMRCTKNNSGKLNSCSTKLIFGIKSHFFNIPHILHLPITLVSEFPTTVSVSMNFGWISGYFFSSQNLFITSVKCVWIGFWTSFARSIPSNWDQQCSEVLCATGA